MFMHLSHTRLGSALLVTTIIIITIAGMAITLTDLTISRYKEQGYRQRQVDLLAAVESAANESISWVSNINTPSVQDALKNLTVSSNTGFPTTTTSTSAVLVSSSLPSGLPAIFPALIASGSSTSPDAAKAAPCAANTRNSCAVSTKIIKVAGSGTAWNGSEKFIVFTTAQFGDSTNPSQVRRQRVETVITAQATSSTTTVPIIGETTAVTAAYPFTKGLFAKTGYEVGGSSTTDSWKSDGNGDGVADTTYVPPASYTVGGPNSNGDVGSNGSLGTGAYDTSRVHGTPTPNAGATLPTIAYAPPATGITTIGAIGGSTTLTGSGTGSTIFKTPSVGTKNSETITIAGSGTVVLYVDGAFDVSNIVFSATSTAKLIIVQNNIGGKGCNFNAQTTIGDVRDPKRFIFITGFSGTGSNEMGMNGGANFSGVVMAPNAGMKFNGNSNFYGSFVGNDFSGNVNGNFKFHYDDSLAGLSWESIMTTIRTTATTTTTSTSTTFAPTAWNVKTIAYGAP